MDDEEKITLVQREYPHLYEGVSGAIKAGNLPPLWGLSKQRAKIWKYDSPKDLNKLIVFLYEELANIGRFGEDARLENYALQLTEEGDYKILTLIDESVLQRFVPTYNMLLWALFVSSKDLKQKNVIRALFLAHGTEEEVRSVMHGIATLPISILNAIETVNIARVVIEVAPKLLTAEPVTADNYLERLMHISRWDVLALESQGLFLGDNPSLKQGLLTRYYNYAEKNLQTYRLSVLMPTAYRILTTGILDVNSESVEVLNMILESRDDNSYAHKAMHWENYNPENDKERKLSITSASSLSDFYELPLVNPVQIFTWANITQLYRIALGDSKHFIKIARSPHFDIDVALHKLLRTPYADARWVSSIVNHDDIFTHINPHTSDIAKVFWTRVMLGSPSSVKLISEYWKPDWKAFIKTLEIIIPDFEFRAETGFHEHINLEALYLLLKQTPIDERVFSHDNILYYVDPDSVGEKHTTLRKKILRFVITHEVYWEYSKGYLKSIMRRLGMKKYKDIIADYNED